MDAKEIRLLRAEEIECRVSTITSKGLSLLLYKDARVDMKILDETFGPLNWRRTHQSLDGRLYCTVDVYDEEKQIWISKMDVGTESYSEKEKGVASDSFKRACFNVGIGRELYSAPFIWVPANKTDIVNRNGKYTCSDRFSVRTILYNKNREIAGLTICNERGEIVFNSIKENEVCLESRRIDKNKLVLLEKELKRTGVTEAEVLNRYNLESIETIDENLYKRVMVALSKTKAA